MQASRDPVQDEFIETYLASEYYSSLNLPNTNTLEDTVLDPLNSRLENFPTLNTSFSPEPGTPTPTLSASLTNLAGSDKLHQSRASTPLSSPYGAPSISGSPMLPSNGTLGQSQQFNQQLLSPTDLSGLYDPYSPSNASVESPLQDNAWDGQYLIPGNLGRYRSNSIHSEASSVAHSPNFPNFQMSSPVLPSNVNSPLLYNDTLSGAEIASLTDQLAGDFSLNNIGLNIQNFDALTQPGIENSSTILPGTHSMESDYLMQGIMAPEIKIDVVDPPNGVSQYGSLSGLLSPGSLSPSDTEPFSLLDKTQRLLPPASNRTRSQSDSDLDASEGDTLNMYSVTNSSSVSLSSQTSDASYLSPSAAEISTRGSHNRHPRNRSSSASPNKERQRSRSRSASRDYILELASLAPGTKKTQLNPSSFECDLCDKKFTRTYNLRSHKRTHTNERPYVCSVCNKAFARQHDRKRHEGLHSGEKKYECKGVLGDGKTPWGCGHKFARADALGRHFRTEAGKECIRMLVEEAEREKSLNGGGVHIYGGNEDAPALTLSPPVNESLPPGMDGGQAPSYFPPALLEQFPMLSGFM